MRRRERTVTGTALALTVVVAGLAAVSPAREASAEQPGAIIHTLAGNSASGVATALSLAQTPADVALISTTLYVADGESFSDGAAVRAIDLPSGEERVVAAGGKRLASDGNALYFSSAAGASPVRVYRFDPATGATDPVAGGGSCKPIQQPCAATSARLTSVSALAASAEAVYIADGSTLLRLTLDGMLSAVDSPVPGNSTIGDIVIGDEGSLFLASRNDEAIYRIAPDGTTALLAGGNLAGFRGDGGPATAAQFDDPRGLAVDGAGNLYVADTPNNRVRVVTADGMITTIAGGRDALGDGGPATEARLIAPRGLAFDRASGSLFVADSGDHRVRRISRDGTITTVAGTGEPTFSGDGGPGTEARLRRPGALATDGFGNVYIADRDNRRVRRVAPDGTITTVLGDGRPDGVGDGRAATAAPLSTASLIQAGSPLAVGPDGALYVSEVWPRDGGFEARIRRVDATGGITTVAGGGPLAGDDVPALAATLGASGIGATAPITGITFDPEGRLVFVDAARIRRVDHDGHLRTIAGSKDDQAIPWSQGCAGEDAHSVAIGAWGLAYGPDGLLYIAGGDNQRVCRIEPDGSVTTVATLSQPVGITFDPSGRLLTRESDRVRRVEPDGTIHTIAGGGADMGSGIPATDAALGYPSGIAYGPGGDLLVADPEFHRVLRVDSDGTLHVVAGNGVEGFRGDGGPGAVAELDTPVAIVTHPSGVVSVLDSGNNRVRRIDESGVITTIAGSGAPDIGDGGAALAAHLPPGGPGGVAVDGVGNLYVTETRQAFSQHRSVSLLVPNGRLRRVDASTGIITTLADQLRDPAGLAIEVDGDVLVADRGAHQVLRVTPAGEVTVVAGRGADGLGGDGGPAVAAEFSEPAGVSIGPDGAIYVADTGNGRVRRIDPGGTITTVAGVRSTVNPSSRGDGGPAVYASLDRPLSLAFDGSDNLYVAERFAVRRITTDGMIDTVAGNYGFSTVDVGEGGSPTATTVVPGGMTVVGDRLLVSDEMLHRVRVIDGLVDEVPPAVLPLPTLVARTPAQPAMVPAGVDVAPDGRLWVADGMDVLRFDPAQPAVEERVPLPVVGSFHKDPATAVATTPDGGAWVAGGPRLYRLGSDLSVRSTVTAERDFEFAEAVAVGPDGTVYVLGTRCGLSCTDTGVIRFDAAGEFIDRFAASYPSARGLAVGGDGRVYIADTGNHRVQVVSVGGAPLFAFGTVGSAPGQLRGPADVHVAGDGSVYVADTGNGRIQRFTADGAFVAAWGAGAFGSQGPTDVSTDEAGRVLAADPANRRIRAFTADGQPLGQYGAAPGSEPGAFAEPVGAAYDDAGRLYVLDRNRVQVFSPDLSMIDEWPVHGGQAIAVAPDGSVTTLEVTQAVRYTPHGQRLGVLRPAELGGWALLGQQLAVDRAGAIYVYGGPCCGFEGDVWVFDRDGRFLRRWDPGPHLVGLAIDAAGRVLGQAAGAVRVYERTGGLVDEFATSGFATGLVADRFGNTYTAGVVVEVSRYAYDGRTAQRFGRAGRGIGEHEPPVALASDPTTGNLAIAETRNHRVQVYALPGVPDGHAGDTVSPVTTLATDAQPNPEGWIAARTATVTLTATDGGTPVAPPTEVAAIEATVDGTPVACASVPTCEIAVGEGVHTVAYRSTDAAGNVESFDERILRIDGTPPEAELATFSGFYRVDGHDGLSGPAVPSFSSPTSTQGLTAFALHDVAGNETTLRVAFSIEMAGTTRTSSARIVDVAYGSEPPAAVAANGATVTATFEKPLPFGGRLLEQSTRVDADGFPAAGLALWRPPFSDTEVSAPPFAPLVVPSFETVTLRTEQGQVHVKFPLDVVPPTTTLAMTPPPNDAGWHRDSVTIDVAAVDRGSFLVEPSGVAGIDGCPDGAAGACRIEVTAEGDTNLAFAAHDVGGNAAEPASLTVRIDRTPPTGLGVNLTPVLAREGEPVAITVSASDALSGVAAGEWFVGEDPGVGHGTAAARRDDGSLTATVSGDLPMGIHTVGVRAIDAAGNWSDTVTAELVVYQPDIPAITGSGRIAVPSASAVAAGRAGSFATFSVDARYQKGQPTGAPTTLVFEDGSLSFESTAVTWYVVVDAVAHYQGEGRLNGRPGYSFRVSATDGPDRLRVRIWQTGDRTTVFDTEPGAPLAASPSTSLAGGSIVLRRR